MSEECLDCCGLVSGVIKSWGVLYGWAGPSGAETPSYSEGSQGTVVTYENRIQTSCSQIISNYVEATYGQQAINAKNDAARAWIKDCYDSFPAPCTEAYYNDPVLGFIENPSYEPSPYPVMEGKIPFIIQLCYNPCTGGCGIESQY